uniref:GAF domain-containing sensor histidine kinase n=1 Tax=Flavobacterium sp. TaxID=239 RepID=UPI00404A4280
MTSTATNDLKRVQALSKYNILDSELEQEYDDITFLASQICQTPISTITFIDDKKQWFKSNVGLPHNESPRATSFCSTAIELSNTFINIPDLFEHKEFKEVALLNGLTTGFYASVILTDPATNIPIGTLCVIDVKPKNLTENQILGLKKLGKQVSNLLELRLNNKTLQLDNSNLHFKYNELEQFASVVSHDIKSPLNNIISLSNLLKEECSSELTETGVQYLNYISESSYALKHFVDAMLEYHKSNNQDFLKKDVIDLSAIAIKVFKTLNCNNEFEIQIDQNLTMVSNAVAIEQILINLLSNGIKYNQNEKVILKVHLAENTTNYELTVTDNGIGISEENLASIFTFFKTLNIKDRYNNYGTGIGLATVKNIVEKLQGTIEVLSEINKGTIFTIYLNK